jgi:glycerophosphoryl diester phosphodiesterase
MKIIAHRGNIKGPNPSQENSLSYLETAIQEGYDVEVDLWAIKDKLYLGHDEPETLLPWEWMNKNLNYLWFHCKNAKALELIALINKAHYFWHENDKYTLTSKGYPWVYPNQELIQNSICVLPETRTNPDLSLCYGVCTDYPLNY